jgi:hypothetical protein
VLVVLRTHPRNQFRVVTRKSILGYSPFVLVDQQWCRDVPCHCGLAKGHKAELFSDRLLSCSLADRSSDRQNALSRLLFAGIKLYAHPARCERHPGLSDLASAFPQRRLLGSARSVVIRRSKRRYRAAGFADRHTERISHKVDHLPSPSRRHSLRRITSCSISLSSVRSATTLRSRCPSAGIPREYPFPPAEAQCNLLFGELRSLHRPASLPGFSLAGFSHSDRSNLSG